MSLRDKAKRIDFGSLPVAAIPLAGSEVSASSARPKTAPGMMMAQAADQRSELLRENEELKEQLGELASASARVGELQDELKGWDGAKATRLLDPTLVARSRWANRDHRHFESASFAEFKGEIAAAGGNVQPIKVRPLPVSADGVQRYELVFGHRRLQACLELGLPVLTVIDNLGEVALFVEMDRENRQRADLSAGEQGVMYRRALDEGLFSSNRKLADAVGADLTNVGRALALARLSEEIVAAFESPLELQFRWARPLEEAWKNDPAGVRARAKEIVKTAPRAKAKEVFERLVGSAVEGGSTVLPPPVSQEISLDGKKVATVAQSRGGAIAISITPGCLDPAQIGDLAQVLEKFLASKGAASRG
jgi:ParB family chromosome partitioning protein